MKKIFKTLAVVVCVNMVLLDSTMAQDGREPVSGLPPAGSKPTSTDYDYELKRIRAFDAVIWSIPMMGAYGYRRSAFKDLGMKNNDLIAYSGLATPKLEAGTANSSTPYLAGFTDLQNGPVVLEIPAEDDVASIFGQITDHWQITIADVGSGGLDKGKATKYLISNSDYDKPIPPGYIHVKSTSNRLYIVMRAIRKPSKTIEQAYEFSKKIRLYYLSDVANPPKQKFVDPINDVYSTLSYYDERYFADLYDIINAESVRPEDMIMMGMLKTLGIEKGKPYNPDENTKKAMRQGAIDAYYHMNNWFNNIPKEKYYWSDRHYASTMLADANNTFTWYYKNLIDLDEKAMTYFWGEFYPSKLLTKPVSQYMVAMKDNNGKNMEAGKLYKLDLPKLMPVKQFWALTVYDFASKGFIYSNSNRTTLSSYDLDKMKKNPDGGVTLYVGPKAPKGLESNWIPTVGHRPLPCIRFYGPTEEFNNKTFKLPDFELVN